MGSFLEITTQRIDDWSYTNNEFGLLMMFFSLFPLFLIGGGAAKYNWLEHLNEHRKGLKMTMIITFALGLFLKLLPYIFERHIATEYIQDIFGGPLLAISYGLLIAFLAEKNHCQ